jgi:hypothetical protein
MARYDNAGETKRVKRNAHKNLEVNEAIQKPVKHKL